MIRVPNFYYTEQEETTLCRIIYNLATSRDLVWYDSPIKNEIRKDKALPEKLWEIASREFEKRNKLHNEFFRYASRITPFPRDLVALAETLVHAKRHRWEYERAPHLPEKYAPFKKLREETLRLVDLAWMAGNHAWQKLITDKNKPNPFEKNARTTRFYSLYKVIRGEEKRNIISYVGTDRIRPGTDNLRTSITLVILAQERRIEYSPSSLYEDEDLESARSSLNEILS